MREIALSAGAAMLRRERRGWILLACRPPAHGGSCPAAVSTIRSGHQVVDPSSQAGPERHGFGTRAGLIAAGDGVRHDFAGPQTPRFSRSESRAAARSSQPTSTIRARAMIIGRNFLVKINAIGSPPSARASSKKYDKPAGQRSGAPTP